MLPNTFFFFFFHYEYFTRVFTTLFKPQFSHHFEQQYLKFTIKQALNFESPIHHFSHF